MPGRKSVDPVTDYARKVISGKIIAGPWVRAACQRHLDDLEKGEKRGLHWDKEKALHAINFFPATLRLAQGKYAGHPFELEPSQKFIVGSLFGWMGKDGYRRFRTGYIEEGKGNGKTPLAAGIGIYGLMADREMAAEIYAAAVTRDQAGILFRDACLMVDASPALSKRIDKTAHNLAYLSTQSFFRPVSSEGRSLDGKRVHMALIDEIHEHKTPIVVEKMRAGTKGRNQALILEITNSGFDQQSICYRHHDYSIKIVTGSVKNDSWFAYVCSLDYCKDHSKGGSPADGCKKCDQWTDKRVWKKANPLLGTAINDKYLDEQVLEAKGMPAKQGIVKRLNFCIWTKGVSEWIKSEIWVANGKKVDLYKIKQKPAYGGLDLSKKNDLSAFILSIPLEDNTCAVLCYFWLPEDGLGERELRDGIPFQNWVDEGFLRTTPGKIVDYSFVAHQIGEIMQEFDLKAIAFDRYDINTFKRHLEDAGVKYFVKEKEEDQGEGIMFIPHGQGYKDMGPAVTVLEDSLLETKIKHGMNPVLTWNASNVEIEQDATSRRKFVKPKDPSKRIDGIVALAMAMHLAKGMNIEKKEPKYQMMFL